MVLEYSNKDGLATIKLNRPDKYNSFNYDLAKAFQKALEACKNDETVRAIIVTGEGKAFCAGQDLAEATSKEGPELESIVTEYYNPIIRQLREIEKPIIAAVNGVAAGAGANIALACDIVVAKKSASFIQAFSSIGLIPDSAGTFFLPRIVGTQRALALMMTGEKVYAPEAEVMNMIYKSVEDGDFDEYVNQLGLKMAKMPTKGLGLTKRAINASFDNTLEQQLELERKLQAEAGRTEDYNEGTRAFMEKRKPNFKGK